MSSKKLTPEMEKALLKKFKKASNSGVFFGSMLEFARLYHTEATKQTPKGEGVLSAEEVLEQLFGGLFFPADSFMYGYSQVIQAMHEYHAQFQQGWRTIEESDKDGYPKIVGYWLFEDWIWHEAYYSNKSSSWFINGYPNGLPTHVFDLLSPPNDQP